LCGALYDPFVRCFGFLATRSALLVEAAQDPPPAIRPLYRLQNAQRPTRKAIRLWLLVSHCACAGTANFGVVNSPQRSGQRHTNRILGRACRVRMQCSAVHTVSPARVRSLRSILLLTQSNVARGGATSCLPFKLPGPSGLGHAQRVVRPLRLRLRLCCGRK